MRQGVKGIPGSATPDKVVQSGADAGARPPCAGGGLSSRPLNLSGAV
jgi:hypothetical protein